jgi:hypothetical protein
MGITTFAAAEALRRSHVVLLEDLRKLEEAARPAPGVGLAEVRSRLGAAHRHVAEHFRFEEQDGYLDAFGKREPRLERAIRQLAAEHGQMEQSLAALLGEANAATRLEGPLCQRVRDWVGALRHHEARESGLIQDALNLDIGSAD